MVESKNVKIRINKIESARRMFTEAVILFFEKRDPIAIHHLIHAVHEILSIKTEKHFINNEKYLTEEGKKVVPEALKVSKNFIKHADRDPDDELDFNPKINEMLLLDCALMLNDCLRGNYLPAKIYVMWNAVKSPNLFSKDSLPKIMEARRAGFDPDNFEDIVIFLKYWAKLQGQAKNH